MRLELSLMLILICLLLGPGKQSKATPPVAADSPFYGLFVIIEDLQDRYAGEKKIRKFLDKERKKLANFDADEWRDTWFANLIAELEQLYQIGQLRGGFDGIDPEFETAKAVVKFHQEREKRLMKLNWVDQEIDKLKNQAIDTLGKSGTAIKRIRKALQNYDPDAVPGADEVMDEFWRMDKAVVASVDVEFDIDLKFSPDDHALKNLTVGPLGGVSLVPLIDKKLEDIVAGQNANGLVEESPIIEPWGVKEEGNLDVDAWLGIARGEMVLTPGEQAQWDISLTAGPRGHALIRAPADYSISQLDDVCGDYSFMANSDRLPILGFKVERSSPIRIVGNHCSDWNTGLLGFAVPKERLAEWIALAVSEFADSDLKSRLTKAGFNPEDMQSPIADKLIPTLDVDGRVDDEGNPFESVGVVIHYEAHPVTGRIITGARR